MDSRPESGKKSDLFMETGTALKSGSTLKIDRDIERRTTDPSPLAAIPAGSGSFERHVTCLC